MYEKVTDGMHHHTWSAKNAGMCKTIEHKMVGDFFNQIESEFNFQVATNHLVLFGECSVCKNKNGLESDPDNLS